MIMMPFSIRAATRACHLRSACICPHYPCGPRAFPLPWPPPTLAKHAAPAQDVPEEVLNVTVTDFNKQYIPSEENPDDGEGPVWVPCDSGELDVEVIAGCQQVGARCWCWGVRFGLGRAAAQREAASAARERCGVV